MFIIKALIAMFLFLLSVSTMAYATLELLFPVHGESAIWITMGLIAGNIIGAFWLAALLKLGGTP